MTLKLPHPWDLCLLLGKVIWSPKHTPAQRPSWAQSQVRTPWLWHSFPEPITQQKSAGLARRPTVVGDGPCFRAQGGLSWSQKCEKNALVLVPCLAPQFEGRKFLHLISNAEATDLQGMVGESFLRLKSAVFAALAQGSWETSCNVKSFPLC